MDTSSVPGRVTGESIATVLAGRGFGITADAGNLFGERVITLAHGDGTRVTITIPADAELVP
jgi:sensor histidine kinase YesM